MIKVLTVLKEGKDTRTHYMEPLIKNTVVYVLRMLIFCGVFILAISTVECGYEKINLLGNIIIICKAFYILYLDGNNLLILGQKMGTTYSQVQNLYFPSKIWLIFQILMN